MTADGFEEGHFDRWRLQTWGEENRGTIAEPPVPFEGSKAFRAVANPRAAASGRFWCEVGRYFARTGDERWWGFAVLFPEDFRADEQNAVICQLHSRQDRELDERSIAPVIVLRVVGEKFLIEVRHDPGDFSITNKWGVGGTVTNERVYEGEIVRGRWIKWVFHTRLAFDDAGGGFLDVWRDGEQVVEYRGPTTVNNAPDKTIRIGLYKKFYKNLPEDAEQVIWFDSFIVGGEKSTYELIEPKTEGLVPQGRIPDGYEGPLHGTSIENPELAPNP